MTVPSGRIASTRRFPSPSEPPADDRRRRKQADPEPFDLADVEPVVSDEPLDRLAVQLAAAGRALPQRREAILGPRAPPVVANVFEKAQFAARSQHSGDLVEGRVRVGDRTEDQAGEHDVERVVDVG